jgi:hypothetical protein
MCWKHLKLRTLKINKIGELRFGYFFRGTAKRTRYGDSCLSWDTPEIGFWFDADQIRHLGPLTKENRFCRNPDESEAPWCLIGMGFIKFFGLIPSHQLFYLCFCPSCEVLSNLICFCSFSTVPTFLSLFYYFLLFLVTYFFISLCPLFGTRIFHPLFLKIWFCSLSSCPLTKRLRLNKSCGGGRVLKYCTIY